MTSETQQAPPAEGTIAGYVGQIEAMLRPVAEQTGETTAALIELLQLVAWQHDGCANYLAADGKPERARVFRLAARAIRARISELRRAA